MEAAVAANPVRLVALRGTAPVSNEDGSIQAVIEGEIYSGRLLRAGLQARGHRFAGYDDSELVVHLYEEHGVDFVKQLCGEFSLLLWDRKNRRLVAVRDRYGVRPLFFARVGDELWFSSRASRLFEAGLPARWDPERFRRKERAPFAGLEEVPPASVLVWEDGASRTLRYWQPPECEPAKDGPWLVEQFGQLLDECVRCRLPAHPAPAFELSGGLDSGAVVALGSLVLGPVDVFTVGFDLAEHDERREAQELADRWHCRMHVVEVSRTGLLNALFEAVVWSEGLACDGDLSARYLLGQAIRKQGFQVILGGEGADQLLLGESAPPAVSGARLPFLDHRLAEFSASLPSYWRAQKNVLREAVRELIPRSLLTRGGHRFAPPLPRDQVVERLREESATDHPLIDRRELLSRLDRMEDAELVWLLSSYHLQRGFHLSVA